MDYTVHRVTESQIQLSDFHSWLLEATVDPSLNITPLALCIHCSIVFYLCLEHPILMEIHQGLIHMLPQEISHMLFWK